MSAETSTRLSKTVVQKLLDKGYQLQEEKADLYKRMETNRSALRGLVDSDVVSEEERKLILELYPIVKRPGAGKAKNTDD